MTLNIKNSQQIVDEDLFLDEGVIVESNLNDENSEIFTNEEQVIMNIVSSWLMTFIPTGYALRHRKLSNGFICFDFNSKWWPICRIKLRTKFENKLCVKICKEASASKCTDIYLKNIDDLPMVKESIESQCIDTRNRFYKYKSEH